MSVGIAVKAMVLNGLGFANRTLYLTPLFFKDKAVDVLLGEDIKAGDLNSHSLDKNGQQQVERGFRFLKDPLFILDCIFLELSRRIMHGNGLKIYPLQLQ